MSEKQVETWTYTGIRYTPDHKPRAVFLDADGTEKWFAAKTGRNLSIGGIYEIPVERHDDERLTGWFGDAKWIGDSESKSQFFLDDRASRLDHQVYLEGKDRQTRDFVAETLAPLKEAYDKTNRWRRRALIALVLEELSR